MKAVIIIPIYKSLPDKVEDISFRKCVEMLSKHPISIITFKELQIDYYLDILKKTNVKFSVECFDALYFRDVYGYNRLMMRRMFYRRFSSYKYMLIYQLDAYVFKDELDYWCSKGYDYIGAPWFEGKDLFSLESKIIGVGNGGFSLRKIRKSISVLTKTNLLKKIRKIYTYFDATKILPFSRFVFFFGWLMGLKKDYDIFNKIINLDGYEKNEDEFWSEDIPRLFKYNVAPIENAIKFSFEVNPSILYEMNQRNLPFGCHKWEVYDFNFWAQFIK